ncbi:hypothetical protein E2C01_091800 [Portunus trituberculatus]|uniref:Uncharacterized protein n=1 Tax=Portunus trituberculatus TaxID=210409 RepID=A0A5B7JTU4_PORTR|nr:hypothetical protein [Portunus trituberculatus]
MNSSREAATCEAHWEKIAHDPPARW